MATNTRTDPAAAVDELTPDQQRALLESEARRNLNMSADEFAARWRAGEFRGSEDPKVTQVAMLLPDAWSSPL